jgi:hypothetical protein
MLLERIFDKFGRRKRLAIFGLTPGDPLPVAALRVREACTRPECSRFAVANSEYLKAYRTSPERRFVPSLKKTAAVTDLTRFSDFAAYADVVSKETDGKYRRAANRAKREGFFTRLIAPGAYPRSLFDIKNSSDARSLGAMPAATGGWIRPEHDDAPEFSPPSCPEHWRVDWGLFNQSNPAMWGFTSLVRSGNLVRLAHMIAHADVLTAGGMKLMQFDMMNRLLARADPWTLGVEHLIHDAIEDGGEGLANWRRYVVQRPHLLKPERLEPAVIPLDFDPQTYLDCNPDVSAARCDPRDHYLRHGILEGRRYRSA